MWVDLQEIETLCDMLLSASDHNLERYDSERYLFISRSRQLAYAVQSCIADIRGDAKEATGSGESSDA